MPIPEAYRTIDLEFDHTRLPQAHFSVPMFFVNSEARSVALGWMKQHNIQIRYYPEAEALLLVRAFDIYYDTLFVPVGQFNEFICEPSDRQFQPDLIYRNLGCPEPEVRKVAMRFDKSSEDECRVVEIFEWYRLVETVYAIAKGDEVPVELDEFGLQPRLELEIDDPALRWEGEVDDGDFEWVDTKGIFVRDGDVYQLLEQEAADSALRERLGNIGPDGFEMKPATLVRR